MYWRNAAILLIALTTFIGLMIKSRAAINNSGGTAFSVSVRPRIWIGVEGVSVKSGVYDCSDKTMAECVIKMARPECIKQDYTRLIIRTDKVDSGDIVKIACDSGFAIVDSVGQLSFSGLIMLGLRPDLNKMKASDFELLAGVGPKLAERIVEYRQNNGGFSSIYELGNVSGIGPKKLNQIAVELNYK